MHIIVGLGNPGKQYENTKHNVGFMTIDQIADKLDITVNKLKHKALVGEGRIGTSKIMLVKPQTYMNLSGESVSQLINYFNIDLEDLTVIYDDIDIPIGALRIRKSGSAGTHNGMRNIIYHLNDDSFNRIRIGIGKDRGQIPLANYVTSGFDKSDVPVIEETILKARDASIALVESGIEHAMRNYNIGKGRLLG
ncbi:MAG: aminoacyl-tRNA hydrolase [Clostridiales Family XIII bacterium]|jgi:PTH1 family peptidyl-tRNA hydrolase|nr:aminoacyl-tRNA hydrolase [Clostridiales Family XIII bacterium]